MKIKVLSKSRFKLGLECANKLYYTNKKEYANAKKEDPFLQALAQGGFQVEELARMHFADGTLIEGEDWNYQALWDKTYKLLQKENIVIYEAAFLIDNLFIRADILIKKGKSIKLIEVKAKSFNPSDQYLFIGKRGNLNNSWKPYLFDIAYQAHVIKQCFPDFNITSYIMMADKSKKASIDGLNQLFRISKNAENRTGIIKKINSIAETGDSVLGSVNITDIIEAIHDGKYLYYDNLSFNDAVNLLKDTYLNNEYPNWPTSFSACKSCEFKATQAEEQLGLKSGFKECFSKQHNWSSNDFKKPLTFEIWSFVKGAKLFNEGKIFMSDLTQDDIGLNEESHRLSNSARQWLQIEKELLSDNSVYVDKDLLKDEMLQWNYPLHFIDFETCSSALPFNKGRKPYEQIAFQFSHHIYFENGTITHASEYINNKAGLFPNFDFIRSLKKSLENDNGDIFRYSYHENSILNAIYIQLTESDEPDKDELISFIKTISQSKNDSTDTWIGDRNMIDLCEIVKMYYYNPLTKGSNSIKAILPAILNTSLFLKNKYSKSLSEINVSSKNFPSTHVWLNMVGDDIVSPYKMLPPLFNNWSEEEIEETLSEIEDISNGGAALTAYAKLQYTDMQETERDEITKGLLKYCELDTLAMVMIFEHFKEDLIN